jgi:hypothetical protein
MTEEEILDVLNQQGVNYMLAGETQQFTQEGATAVVAHIFICDTRENRIELNFALQELGGKPEVDGPELQELPADPDWLLLAPAHCVRCARATLFIFRSFPGLKDSYEEIKKRAELVIRPGGEMHFCMGIEDKLKFVRAFEEGNASN